MLLIRIRRWMVAATAAAIFSLAAAQTSTKCNPLTTTCQPDPALGRSATYDFTQGPSSDWTASGNPTYDSNGASFTIAGSGDAPTLISNWYIMFGHVDVVMKSAPGVGIVSTLVLESDDLDEIDLEWLGADDTQVQSNYFSKGQTTTYNRGAFHANPGNQDGFHTYSVDYTADQVVWSIDGTTVRALTAASSGSEGYPQTPMQIKIGAWSAGDPSNPPGTIQWAGGPTNYGGGPFTMQVKSVTAKDYSTGTTYSYGDNSGSWQSIKSSGGQINSGGDGTPPSAPAPSVTAVSNGAPLPFEGTHRDTTSTFVQTGYPWVPLATTLQTQGVTVTTYPGLPSGWSVSSSGKVVPPSAAPSTSPPASYTSSPAVSQPGLSSAPGGGYEVSTIFDQQGFPTVVTYPPGYATMSKSYNSQGFLITPGPVAPAASVAAGNAAGQKASDHDGSGVVNSDAAASGGVACTKEIGFSTSLMFSLVLGTLLL